MKNGFIKQQTSLKKGLTLYVCLRQSQMGESEKTWSFQPCMAILTGKKWLNGGLGKCCLITIWYNTWILIGYHPLIWNVDIHGYSWILMNINGYWWILLDINSGMVLFASRNAMLTSSTQFRLLCLRSFEIHWFLLLCSCSNHRVCA